VFTLTALLSCPLSVGSYLHCMYAVRNEALCSVHKRRSCMGHNSNIGALFCTEYLVSETTFLCEGESTQQGNIFMMWLSVFPAFEAYLTVGADYRHLLEQFVLGVCVCVSKLARSM
jgi:hypothetical protein